MESFAITYRQGKDNVIFEQDNCRPHTAAVGLCFLQDANINILLWTARSPDLLPIERIWNMMCRSVGNLPNPPINVLQLHYTLQVALDDMLQDSIDHFIIGFG